MVARPYSFVNAPNERPHEFYYVTLPDGPLTQRLSKLEAGTRYAWRRGRGVPRAL